MPGQQSCKLSSANSAQRQLYIVHFFFILYYIFANTFVSVYLCECESCSPLPVAPRRWKRDRGQALEWG